MRPEYAAWIEKHCAGPQGGFCHSRATDMQEAFPELVLCRGYYVSVLDGSRPHWWLKDAEGSVIDPTAAQFQMKDGGVYQEYEESIHGELPIGKCMNCGSEVFESENPPASCCCSPECGQALDGFYNSELKRLRGCS